MDPLEDTQPPTHSTALPPPGGHGEVRVPAYLATIVPGDYAHALLHPDSLLHLDIPRERTIYVDDPLDDKVGTQ